MINGDTNIVVLVNENELELLLQILIEATSQEGVDLLEDWCGKTLEKYLDNIQRIKYLGDEYLDSLAKEEEQDGSTE